MISIRQTTAVIGLILLLGGTAAYAKKSAEQPYSRLITPVSSVTSTTTYGIFEPDTAAFTHAGKGLRSLRIFNSKGKEIPYRSRFTGATGKVTTGKRTRRVKPLSTEVASTGALFATGTTARGVARPTAHNAIHVRVIPIGTDAGFTSTMTVKGSDNKKDWHLLGRAAVTLAHPNASPRVAEGTVTYRRSAYRYLRVRVPGARKVIDAQIDLIYGQRFYAAPMVQRRPTTKRKSQAGRDTRLTLDFSRAGVPVKTIELQTSTPSFNRTYDVEITNSQAELDHGRALPVASGSIVRNGAVNKTKISGIDSTARYVRVLIHNGDDGPLTKLRIRAFSRSRAVLFPVTTGETYKLSYGGRLTPPSYDIARLALDPAQVLNATKFKLGREEEHPQAVSRDRDSRTWVDRHRGITNLVGGLVAALVLLGVVWVLLRTGTTSEADFRGDDSND